jgi:hypothetical protein
VFLEMIAALYFSIFYHGDSKERNKELFIDMTILNKCWLYYYLTISESDHAKFLYKILGLFFLSFF